VNTNNMWLGLLIILGFVVVWSLSQDSSPSQILDGIAVSLVVLVPIGILWFLVGGVFRSVFGRREEKQ